jgi:hypothetical protein
VGEGVPLRLGSVFEERARGADGEGKVLDAEAGKTRRAELLEEAALAALHIEMPGGEAGGEVAVHMDAIGDQHFGGSDATQLVV